MCHTTVPSHACINFTDTTLHTTQPHSTQKAEVAALMLNDDSPPASLEDYWTIQPRRTDMIMKWLNEPFLKAAPEGYYVRYSIGDANNKSVCRMCKVVGVDLNARPYKLAETGACVLCVLFLLGFVGFCWVALLQLRALLVTSRSCLL